MTHFLLFRFSFDDKEIQNLIQKEDELSEKFNGLVPEDLVPGLKYVYKSNGMKMFEEFYEEFITNFVEKKYKQEVASYDGSKHFCLFVLKLGTRAMYSSAGLVPLF